MEDLTIKIHVLCALLIVIGCVMLYPTRGNLTTGKAKAGAVSVTLGLLILAMGYTGVLGSLMAKF